MAGPEEEDEVAERQGEIIGNLPLRQSMRPIKKREKSLKTSLFFRRRQIDQEKIVGPARTRAPWVLGSKQQVNSEVRQRGHLPACPPNQLVTYRPVPFLLVLNLISSEPIPTPSIEGVREWAPSIVRAPTRVGRVRIRLREWRRGTPLHRVFQPPSPGFCPTRCSYRSSVSPSNPGRHRRLRLPVLPMGVCIVLPVIGHSFTTPALYGHWSVVVPTSPFHPCISGGPDAPGRCAHTVIGCVDSGTRVLLRAS